MNSVALLARPPCDKPADHGGEPRPKTHALTHERLTDRLNYDPDTGLFTWRKNLGGIRAGTTAGRINEGGYIEIKIDGTGHKAHRLAWLYTTGCRPTLDVDHRDSNRTNNRISNLREATKSENAANTKKTQRNSSGFKGVSKLTWAARIRHKGKIYHLGQFKTPEEAHAAYTAAAERLNGEFARVK